MKASDIPKYLNLGLAICFPIAWFSPLIRTGLLVIDDPWGWFAADTITVVSGLQTLWGSDVFLAIAVTFFALVAPMLKCLGLALIDYDLLSKKTKPVLRVLGKLAMADIFILSLFVVIFKGIGIGSIEVAWGLYLFTGCVIVSMVLSLLEKGGKGYE